MATAICKPVVAAVSGSLSSTQPTTTCAGKALPSPFFGAPTRSALEGRYGGPLIAQNLPQRERGSRQRGVAGQAHAMADAGKADEFYEVELERPFGIRFCKGGDGGTYIDAVSQGSLAEKLGVTPGDKVLATSAAFGSDMWPAAEYGRVMYTVKNRIGTLVVKLQRRYGERPSAPQSSEQLTFERKSGMVGDALKELQYQNYMKKLEEKAEREALLTSGLKLYKLGKYDDALKEFDSVLALKPDFRESSVTCYNRACCFSKLGKVADGLRALEEAMEAGFEDYKAVRTDPDLETLRQSPEFTPLMNRYDEPFINENALAAIKGVFGFFGKK
eukprot:TRINITY_DN6133_c0_g2_i1.p1 TRINITY_DN6133_c0_g2~~TRINITY_DN6133_c0_g2_i1.p1  ORF type:complete len:331 (-),score=69.22 TRINITY_DN6133_c0_g2_i1:26-1018(-)